MHNVKENIKVFDVALFLNLEEKDVFDDEKIHREII